MTAIIKRPGQPAFTREIENTLKALQDLVDGHIETVLLPGGVCMIVNDAGKLLDFPPNFRLGNDLIVGTAVFVGVSGEEFCGLSASQQSDVWWLLS